MKIKFIEYFSKLKLQFLKKKDKSKFIQRNEYGYTCLIDSLDKVINYYEALNETFINVSVRPRKEQKLFSGEAFKT